MTYIVSHKANTSHDLDRHIVHATAIDLLLGDESCAIFSVGENGELMDDLERRKLKGDEEWPPELPQRPMAINYGGQTDWPTTVLLQDPWDRSLLYELEKNGRKFNIRGTCQPWFTATDKMVRLYTLRGDPQEVFEEFRRRGYFFERVPLQP